jgi:iron complex transport system substrate-binding protein
MHPRRPLHRRTTLAVLLIATLLLVAGATGCSGDSHSSSSTADGSGEVGSEDFDPVTIDHLYGSTEVAERPERIVSLDLQWTDVLTALGAPPAGYLADELEGTLPWQTELGGSTVLEGSMANLPYEKIVDLEPDLIVVTYYAQSSTEYERLSEIAPTIATLNEEGSVDTWQSIAEVAGQLVGGEDVATALVEDVDGQVDALAEELPGLEGATFAFANYVPGDLIYVLTDPDDGANVLPTQLGMVIPSDLRALDAPQGRAQISLERIGLLDAEVLFLLTQGTDPATITGYAQLPAVQAGAAMVLDYSQAVALNTPTPLSIPWVLEQVEPTLVEVGA